MNRARWLEVSVAANVEAVEAVSEILGREAIGGVAVEEPVPPEAFGVESAPRARDGADHLVKGYLQDEPGSRERLARVRDAIGHLQAFGLGPIGDVRVREIDDADWLEAWKETFRPIRIGAFLVRPTWSAADADAGAIPLVLDPGMAFGTGLHPTTQLCLRRIGELELAGRSLLDVGCGSGILAIGAAKRGAAPVRAVDTDPLAVDATAENAAGNAVAIETAGGSAADVAGRFDVVVANIVAPVLRAIAGDLADRVTPGGTLLLSGVIVDAEAGVRETFAGLGFHLTARAQEGDWVALTLTRSAA